MEIIPSSPSKTPNTGQKSTARPRASFDDVWEGRGVKKGRYKADAFFETDKMKHEFKGGDFLDDFAGALKSGFFAECFNDLVDGVDFGFDLDPVFSAELA